MENEQSLPFSEWLESKKQNINKKKKISFFF